MSCALERLLSGYVDGDLELREMARVRDHLDGCASCARAHTELRRTVTMVRSLPNDAEPPASMWNRIAAELDSQVPAESGQPRLGLGLPPWRRILRPVSVGVGALALAAAACLLLLKPAAAGRDPLLEQAQKEFAAAEAHYAEAARQLRQHADAEKKSWRPEFARAFDENLRIIDEALERTRQAAQRPGADATAMDNVAAAYRRKFDFLEEAIRSGAAGGRELDPL